METQRDRNDRSFNYPGLHLPYFFYNGGSYWDENK